MFNVERFLNACYSNDVKSYIHVNIIFVQIGIGRRQDSSNFTRIDGCFWCAV